MIKFLRADQLETPPVLGSRGFASFDFEGGSEGKRIWNAKWQVRLPAAATVTDCFDLIRVKKNGKIFREINVIDWNGVLLSRGAGQGIKGNVAGGIAEIPIGLGDMSRRQLNATAGGAFDILPNENVTVELQYRNRAAGLPGLGLTFEEESVVDLRAQKRPLNTELTMVKVTPVETTIAAPVKLDFGDWKQNRVEEVHITPTRLADGNAGAGVLNQVKISAGPSGRDLYYDRTKIEADNDLREALMQPDPAGNFVILPTIKDSDADAWIFIGERTKLEMFFTDVLGGNQNEGAVATAATGFVNVITLLRGNP